MWQLGRCCRAKRCLLAAYGLMHEVHVTRKEAPGQHGVFVHDLPAPCRRPGPRAPEPHAAPPPPPHTNPAPPTPPRPTPPAPPVSAQLTKLANGPGAPGLVVIVNPQWETRGNLVSDFGFGQRKVDSEKFINSFEPSYFLKSLRVYGDQIRCGFGVWGLGRARLAGCRVGGGEAGGWGQGRLAVSWCMVC